MGRFDGASILITGCSSGIGRALVEGFSESGHSVLATARNPEELEDLESPRVRTARLDVTDPKSILSAVEALVEWTGRIDVAVNNAGYGLIAPIAEVAIDDLRAQFETNLFGLVAVTQAVVPHMARQKSGRIVNMGSVSGVTTTPFGGPYSASKAAVHMVSDALRMELAPWNIEVLTVQPGSVKSAFGERASEGVERFRYDSLYSEYSDSIEARSKISQYGAMPAAEFAERVIEAATTQRPPVVLRGGKNSFFLPLLAHLPVRFRDRFLSRKFGLAR